MKRISSKWTASGLPLVLLASAMAGEEDANRFGFAMRMGFNVHASFREQGMVGGSSLAGPATGGGMDRVYDDGFVKVDSSGNRGGQTWNWGYDRADQIVGQTLQLHSSTASALGDQKAYGDPQWGGELSYERRLGQWSWGKWGLQSGLNFTQIDIESSQSQAGSGVLLTDSYALNGIVPPLAPYAGSYAGPGAVIGDSPTRTLQSLPGGSTTLADRRVEAQLYGLRLGPYVEIPLGKGVGFQVSGGLALGVVDSEFSYTDRGTSVRGGSDRSSEVLAGAYAEGQFSVRVSTQASLFAGAQYQYLPDFEQQVDGKEAVLGLGQSVFCTAGVKVSF